MRRHLFAALLFLAGSSLCAVAQENADCLACHSDPTATGTRDGKTFSVHVSEKGFGKSAHAEVPCVGCHADLAGTEFPHAEDPARVDCAACHADEGTLQAKSLHGKAAARGDPLAPRCKTCPPSMPTTASRCSA